MDSATYTLDPKRTGGEAHEFENRLRGAIAGQEEAVRRISQAYQVYTAGLSPSGRPVANFLFLGPTGTGKTRMVEATAEAVLGTPGAITKIDCAEFQHSHEIAKLIGSPPGYLGHRETKPLLCQETIDQYLTPSAKISFVLFDEIEKASDALWHLLLGILDKATLTLGDGKKVNFSNAMIFMTSNLGAKEMNALLSPRLGFASAATSQPGELNNKIDRSGVAAARRHFTPEFVNRLDHIVVFKPLADTDLMKILDIELAAVQQRVVDRQPEQAFELQVSAAARRLLLAEGTDERYGARHLKRAIERLVVQPIANLVATGQLGKGDTVQVDCAGGAGELVFSKGGNPELQTPWAHPPMAAPAPVRDGGTGEPQTHFAWC
ncbi:MAG: AAA family ATPase [Bryobacteraceae bacterium]